MPLVTRTQYAHTKGLNHGILCRVMCTLYRTIIVGITHYTIRCTPTHTSILPTTYLLPFFILYQLQIDENN